MAGWHHWLDGRESEWTPGVVMDMEAWRAVIHGVAKSRTRLSDWTELNWTELNQPFALAIENCHHSRDSFCAPLAPCLGCISFQPLGVLTCLSISISLIPKPTQYALFCPLRCPPGCSLNLAFPSHSESITMLTTVRPIVEMKTLISSDLFLVSGLKSILALPRASNLP